MQDTEQNLSIWTSLTQARPLLAVRQVTGTDGGGGGRAEAVSRAPGAQGRQDLVVEKGGA